MKKSLKLSKKREISSSKGNRNKSRINYKILTSSIVVILLIIAGFHFFSNKDIAAAVNGEKITKKRVDAIYDSLPKGTNLTKQDILNKLVDTKLLVDYIKQNGFDLSNSEYEMALNATLKNSNLTMNQLKSNLELRGASLQDVDDNVLIQNFIAREISPKITITADEVKSYRSTFAPSASDAEIQKAIYYDKQGQILSQLIDTERKMSEINYY